MSETAYKYNSLITKALGGGNTFLKAIFTNILPLAAVSCTLLFCACGKDDLPILQSETPTAEVELRRLLPGSSWHIAQLGYTEGDVEVNAAWQGMTVDFTSDSAFFYRQDLVYDPISQSTTPETTLAKSCIFCIKDGKITLDTTEFRVESADSARISLASDNFTMLLTAAEKSINT